MDGRNRQRKLVIMQMSQMLQGFPVFWPAPHSVSLPAPFPADSCGVSRTRVPRTVSGPSIKCRFQAVQGAAASGFSLLLTFLCTLLASVEKCPPGRWLRRDPTAQEVGSHPGHEGASQTQTGPRLCCRNRALVQWAWGRSLYCPQ